MSTQQETTRVPEAGLLEQAGNLVVWALNAGRGAISYCIFDQVLIQLTGQRLHDLQTAFGTELASVQTGDTVVSKEVQLRTLQTVMDRTEWFQKIKMQNATVAKGIFRHVSAKFIA